MKIIRMIFTPTISHIPHICIMINFVIQPPPTLPLPKHMKEARLKNHQCQRNIYNIYIKWTINNVHVQKWNETHTHQLTHIHSQTLIHSLHALKTDFPLFISDKPFYSEILWICQKSKVCLENQHKLKKSIYFYCFEIIEKTLFSPSLILYSLFPNSATNSIFQYQI